jgi:hypothetical protein
MSSYSLIKSGVIVAAVVAASSHSALGQTTVNFGEEELFDFGTFAPETRYGWSSGDALVAPLDFNARVGGFTGKRNQVVVPEVKAFGVTVIPEVRADTRTGARLTTSLQGEAGVELTAGLTVGGEGFNATIQAGPSLTTANDLLAGQFFRPIGTTGVGLDSTFDPGLPVLDAGLGVVLNGSFDNRFEYGLFPFANYTVGDFGFDFNLDFDLFDLNLDLNLPKLPSINLPDFPDFTIPASEEDDTLFRQKIPPSNPALNLAELALDNPLASIDTETTVADGKATFSAKGSIFRAGLDLDGIASAVTTGVSFTGTEVKIGPGKIGYDVIDVKYGLELGIEYDTEVDPFLNATLTFDKAVTMKNADGTTTVVNADEALEVRWDELPEFALLTREDVNVDVDFTGIEATFSHTGALTLSDYMELQALRAKVSVAPGVNLVDLGPAYYQKFPLAGELAAFEVFSDSFSLGQIAFEGAFEGLWDGSFVLEAKPIKEVYLDSVTADFDFFSQLTEIATGINPSTLSDKTLVIGTANGAVTGLPDLVPIDYLDNINEVAVNVGGLYLEGALILRVYDEDFDVVDVSSKTVLDGLVVLENSKYTLEAGAIRQFDLNFVANDGQIVGDGALSFESTNGSLTFSGEGEVMFNSPGRLEATTLTNAEGHTLSFQGFSANARVIPLLDVPDENWFNGPFADPFTYQSYINGNTFRFNHEIEVGTFNNFGTLAFSGNNSGWDYSFTRFNNFESGRVELSGGASVSLSTTSGASPVLYNDGTFYATGTGTTLNIDHEVVRTQDFGSGRGTFVADNNARITFDGDFLTLINQDFEAKNGGEIVFDVVSTFNDSVRTFGNVEFLIQEGSTIRFNSGLTNKDFDGLSIINHGTLEVDGSVVSLRPKPDVGLGGPPPTLIFKDLINTGTINVRNGGEFEVDAIIDNFANDGATLSGGTWNAIGENVSAFSNLSAGSSTVSEIDFRVLDVAPADDFLFEVYTDLQNFDTTLKTNAANVTIGGRAIFPYFNTVEKNTGSFRLTGGHQFTTATSYTNEGGTTVVQKGADLFVQGALKVIGGSVTADAVSTITALTQTEAIDEAETEFRDITVEVIGGDLTLANTNALPSSPMFADRSDSGLFPEFNNMLLNSDQVWIVRESVDIDPDTLEETVTSATIDLGNAAIERNNGTIVIDGASASFDAAERMRYNHGSLTLQNGFEFDTLINDFRNANEGTMTLQGATFRVTGPNGQFRNDGELIMDGDSYLFAGQFVNGGAGTATVWLDGVIEADTVINSAGSTITGSGSITGSIVNNGTIDLGNSPGLIETFGSYSQGSAAELFVEIQGYEAGESFDQLIVHLLNADTTSPLPPAVLLDGSLRLDFDLGFEQDFDWIILDNKGSDAIVGEFNPDNILIEGLMQGSASDAALLDDPDDLYLGDLEYFGVYLTYFGGDGNDVALYTISTVDGDADLDGDVDSDDFNILAFNFGEAGGRTEGDFNGDGVIDSDDFNILAFNFGTAPLPNPESLLEANAAQIQAVPEPTTLTLFALGGLLAARRRRYGYTATA